MERQIKGIIFDVDGTLIEEISWQKLNLALGVTPELDKRLFDEYRDGKFNYQEWIDQLVDIYISKGPVHRSKIEQILTQFTLAKDALNVFRTLEARPYRIGIVSGGLDVVVKEVAKQVLVNPDCAFSNSIIEYDEKGYLKNIIARGHDHETKLQDFQKLCKQWGVLPSECACVGDGWPDRPLFEATGNGITFDYERCSILHDVCWKQISQISDLLKFL